MLVHLDAVENSLVGDYSVVEFLFVGSFGCCWELSGWWYWWLLSGWVLICWFIWMLLRTLWLVILMITLWLSSYLLIHLDAVENSLVGDKSCIYARSLSSLLDSNSKLSRRILRTDGDFDCPGADLLLYPLGLVSLWMLPPARYSRPQTSRVTVTVATSPLPAYSYRTFDGTLLSCPQSFPIPDAWPGPVPSHSPTNWSTLLTLSLCRSSRDPLLSPNPSLSSKGVKSKHLWG